MRHWPLLAAIGFALMSGCAHGVTPAKSMPEQNTPDARTVFYCNGLKVVQDLLEVNEYNLQYKLCEPFTEVKYITIHNTANKATAQNERDYLNRRRDNVSISFHFAVDDGRPMVYAVNDFHIRFYNTYGRMAEDSARFIDTRVSREVTGAFALTDLDGTIASPTPPADSIAWYTVEALAGDSLALRADRECTLHVFSPAGEELYRADGAAAKEFGGCGLGLDGTYYIALHDVTEGDAATVNLEYERFTDGGSGIAGTEADGGAAEPVNVYDSSGRLVRSQVAMGEALNGLPHGVYIIKDKKYLVK